MSLPNSSNYLEWHVNTLHWIKEIFLIFPVFGADPFAEANAEEAGAGTKDYAHICIQQRNGHKSLSTVQGLKKDISYNKILKDLKKEFCCNSTVVQDPEMGQVIQLRGDQHKNVSNFLIQAGIVKKEHILYTSRFLSASSLLFAGKVFEYCASGCNLGETGSLPNSNCLLMKDWIPSGMIILDAITNFQ
ncbi:protein translation factor SUI1 homolog [Carex rostrata]